MTTPLSIDDLYTDSGAFDEQGVLKALRSKIAFTKDNDIIFTDDPTKMKAGEVVLLFALAKKILKFHSKIQDEVTTNAELISKAKMKKSTSSVTIMRLKEKKLLLPSGAGYEIPMFKVAEVLATLADDKSE